MTVRNVPEVKSLRQLAAELREAQLFVGLADAFHLLPGPRHQLPLPGLNHLRPQPGRGAVPALTANDVDDGARAGS